jgi:hypothetical protein
MGRDTDNLLVEYQECWQKLQTATTSLPVSVQGLFNDFLVSNGPPLTDTLTLRQHIGQTLSQSADLAESLDNAISQSFQ